MAVAFDAATDGGEVLGTSLTFAHTCTGADRALVVGIFVNSTTDHITGVTYAGSAMTRQSTVSTGNVGRIYIYTLLAPASGANNVVVSSASTTFSAGAVSFTGVGAVSGVASAVANTVNIVSQTGAMVVDMWAAYPATTQASNQTARVGPVTDVLSTVRRGMSTAAGAASVTMSYTDTADDLIIGLSVDAVAASFLIMF